MDESQPTFLAVFGGGGDYIDMLAAGTPDARDLSALSRVCSALALGTAQERRRRRRLTAARLSEEAGVNMRLLSSGRVVWAAPSGRTCNLPHVLRCFCRALVAADAMHTLHHRELLHGNLDDTCVVNVLLPALRRGASGLHHLRLDGSNRFGDTALLALADCLARHSLPNLRLLAVGPHFAGPVATASLESACRKRGVSLQLGFHGCRYLAPELYS